MRFFPRCPILAANSTDHMKITSDFLPPFPSILFPAGKVKFVFNCETIGLYAGQKKMEFLNAVRIYGIFYNSDLFKNYKEVCN